MSAIGSPTHVHSQPHGNVAVSPGQPVPTARTINYPVDLSDAPASSGVDNSGVGTGEALVRKKRGFKVPGFRMPTPNSRPYDIPSHGTPGVYTAKSRFTPSKVNVQTPKSSGSANSNSINKFRDLIFNASRSSTPAVAPLAVSAPKTFGDVASNLVAADRLVKAGVFKTDASLKTVVRDAFVNASVNGVVSTPLSIGAYAGSVWSGETIKGSFSANTPLLPPAHQPAPSQQSYGGSKVETVDSKAQDDATIKLRLENAELKILFAGNTILAMLGGGDADAVEENPTRPIGTKARLDNLERLYGAAERSMRLVAEKNDFIFRPYKADTTSEPQSDEARLDILEKRYEEINSKIGFMNAVGEVQLKNT